MQNLNPTPAQLKEIDKTTALNIAGFAGLPTRSAQGIIHPDIWTMYEDHKTIGQLMSAADMRALLKDNISMHIAAQHELLKKSEEHTSLVDWILEITQTWEEQYANAIQSNFDIAQTILSAMQEAVFEIKDLLEVSVIAPTYVRNQILTQHTANSTLPTDDAVTRFYFRNPYTSQQFCRLAGKILQKKEVCNKQGAYSSKIQRHDITVEKDNAVHAVVQMLSNYSENIGQCRDLIDSQSFAYWIIDHKRDFASREKVSI